MVFKWLAVALVHQQFLKLIEVKPLITIKIILFNNV